MDAHQQSVAVAIDRNLCHLLGIAARSPFVPKLVAAAAPEVGLAAGKGALKRLPVHIGEHQHLARLCILDDGRDKAAVIKAQEGKIRHGEHPQGE